MIPLDSSLLVVTDLDGSLLDHHDYNWDAASEWLARLKQHQIPLVICSSKTAAEIVPLQKKLGISGAPFIAENGACVSPGGDYPLADEPGRATPHCARRCKRCRPTSALRAFIRSAMPTLRALPA